MTNFRVLECRNCNHTVSGRISFETARWGEMPGYLLFDEFFESRCEERHAIPDNTIESLARLVLS